MTLNLLLAYTHLLALGLGVYSIWTRAEALKKLQSNGNLSEVFKADNIWGISSLLWIITGLWRAFGGIEKGSDYYINNSNFIFKMILFGLIFLLELKPMIALVKWRMSYKKGRSIDYSKASGFSTTSYIQLVLLFIMILFAVAMARGKSIM
jgi:putative membrane protein